MMWVRSWCAVWFIWASIVARAASGLPESSAASTAVWCTMALSRIRVGASLGLRGHGLLLLARREGRGKGAV